MANNRFKVDNGLAVTGNAEFYQRIDAFANAHFNNDLFVVSGNLVVNGTLIYANVVIGNGGIRSIADQQDLGNTTNRFNLFGYRVQVDDTLVPLANGVAVGNTTRRFEVFANNLNATTITVGSTSINATYFDGTAKSANTINGLYANGIIVRTGNTTAVARSIATSTTGITITNGNGVSGNPSIDIAFQSGLFANSTGVYVNASSIGDGTLPIGRGGTGGPDRTTALNNLLPAQSAGVADYVLRTDGTNASWVLATGPTGFSGSRGFTGSVGATGGLGYTGSQGDKGFTGSAGTNGFWGSVGYTGSRGEVGFTGSQGDRGFTGSKGIDGYWGSVGYTGSRGEVGYTGSQGDRGYTGSLGYTGSQGIIGYSGSLGYTGSASTVIGYTGSRGYTGSYGDIGFTGSASTVIGYTGSQGIIGYTGSASTVIGYTGSRGIDGYTGSASTVRGYTGSQGDKGFTGSVGATGTFSGSYTGNMAITGSITATGDITAFFSDDRLKTKLGNIDSALDKLLALSGFIFEPNELAQSLGYEKKREVGVSAQEVEAVLPEAIATAPIDSKYMAVKYERLIPLIIEAIKELKIEVDKIKGE
jgi:hypothetical protein